MATTKELTDHYFAHEALIETLNATVEAQAAMLEQLAARIEELEAARVGMRGWAEKVQAHLTHKPAAKKQSDWVSGPRPSHPVRRPEPQPHLTQLVAEIHQEREAALAQAPCEEPSVPEACPF
jgi:hypothetical protein